MFLLVIIFFIGMSLWLAAEADRAHNCLLDDKCVERYRAKVELNKQETSDYRPSAHPAYLNNRFQVLFY
jgi:hypothetical protein